MNWTGRRAADQRRTQEARGRRRHGYQNGPQRRNGAASPVAPSRDAIREELQQGRTSDQIAHAAVDIRTTWFIALEEEARLAGELNTIEPSAENVAWLRDDRHLRWERIAVRIYGDAGRANNARRLYEQARGAGAAKRSYTGRGRRFPDMDP
jgi:hypothetical protein